ncbi:MAG: Na(+)-translocating NADH-quinone reductase subunit A [Bacteroidales bacterium]|jgi:Na+-transporting NADH:ubiquinone oxidoreductase subunit A
MARNIGLKRGFDIKIKGNAEKLFVGRLSSSRYGVKPVDFPGLEPKMVAKLGDEVKAGSPLFHDKKRPSVIFASPVSGKVVEIRRGERRRILEVVVEKEGDLAIDFVASEPEKLSREEIISKLTLSGLWPAIRQRPYHIVANPDDAPKAIFISGFDTAPLAADSDFIMANSSAPLFYKGLSALSKLTTGRVNLVLNGAKEPLPVFKDAVGVDIYYVTGPHPAGNVGVHIHHIDPLNKGEVVWTVNLQDVIAIGRLFDEGVYRPERIIALAGSEVVKSGYYSALAGVSVEQAMVNNLKTDNVRVISGNVLTGTKIEYDGFLGFYDSQITVIPEGNYYEMFGWAKPGFKKYTFSRTFLSAFLPGKSYRLDTNFHGEERPFVMTGNYEKVVPMDIYPMYLFKAILARDIDMMEQLGIYEVAEEDFALCEFICPSKIGIQSIIRDGLSLMVKEMS